MRRGIPTYARHHLKADNNPGCAWLIVGALFFPPLLIVAMIQSERGSTTRNLAIAAFVLWLLVAVGALMAPVALMLA